MKILYVVPFVPWEVKVRSFNLIPRLARKNEIYLACVSSKEPSAEQQRWMNRYCKRVVYVRHSRLKGMAQCLAALPTSTPLRMAYCGSNVARERVRRLCDEIQPDVVYLERWRALSFLPEGLRTPLVCDPTDSMTLYNERLKMAGAWWERLVGEVEHRRFLGCEGKLARRADVVLFCSKVDLECVKKQEPDSRCELVPNGVDCKRYVFKREGEEEPNMLVFAGSFEYRPNFHAARFFLEKIFPLIRREEPQARFLAVGNGAKKALAKFRGIAGFEAVDFVPDLRPYLAKAAVTVAPLTVGSGVSNKLAEGFAVGTSVVATPLACGDMAVKNGEHLLVAGDAGAFAEHVIRLLQDADLRRGLAIRARRLVEEKYDWEVVYRRLQDIFSLLVAAKGQPVRTDGCGYLHASGGI